MKIQKPSGAYNAVEKPVPSLRAVFRILFLLHRLGLLPDSLWGRFVHYSNRRTISAWLAQERLKGPKAPGDDKTSFSA
jgi:hypothetical protein